MYARQKRRLSLELAAILAAAVTLFGCNSLRLSRYGTPKSVDPLPTSTYPVMVSYELLGVGSGQACGNTRDTKMASIVGRTSDPATFGNAILFQEAKYKAIEAIDGADNLMYIRAKMETKGTDQCVTVTGRGYRLIRLDSQTGAGAAHE